MVFHEMCDVVNRAPENITVRYDGQEITLPPGANRIPVVTVPFGKNQNPVMGSQDPNNPHMGGADYLLGVVGEDNCALLTAEEWASHLDKPCRHNAQAAFEEKYGGDPKAKMVVLNKGKKSTASSRADAGGTMGGIATFEKDR